MTTPSIRKDAYTDAPDLHPNLLLASLQLLFWLFFHPTAWRNYITRLDPDLHPDFNPLQFLEQPVKDFALRYESAASQRVLDLTHCHPFLVQLLCAEIVALKNEQDPNVRRFATMLDVEAAVTEALKSGSFFFADIERNQVDDTGRVVLRYIATQGEGIVAERVKLAQVCPLDLDATLKRLLQRELIEPIGDGYRFQVELIRRWFAQAN